VCAACNYPPVNDRALADLRSLAARDDELAARAGELRAHDAEAARIRERAEAIDAFFDAYPAEDDLLRAAVREAEADVARRRGELAKAEAALAESDDPEHAEKAVRRARDHIAVAESALLRARSAHDELERAAAELPLELTALEDQAGAHGTRELIAWAAARHAELFVELGQIDMQRERVIREANELASMLLGDSTHGSTVAQALAKVVGPLARE
jgi:chromosome segregation ATPase